VIARVWIVLRGVTGQQEIKMSSDHYIWRSLVYVIAALAITGAGFASGYMKLWPVQAVCEQAVWSAR
jgi:hypothetical protein